MTRKADPQTEVKRSKAGRPRIPPFPVEGGAPDAPEFKGNPPAPKSTYEDPEEFLRAVWQGKLNATSAQIQAAKAVLSTKASQAKAIGKKEMARQNAAETQQGRFAPIGAPIRRVK